MSNDVYILMKDSLNAKKGTNFVSQDDGLFYYVDSLGVEKSMESKYVIGNSDWFKKQEWGIIEIKADDGVIIYSPSKEIIDKCIEKGGERINAVKRLSDDKIFRKGEHVYYHKNKSHSFCLIDRFEIKDGEIYVNSHWIGTKDITIKDWLRLEDNNVNEQTKENKEQPLIAFKFETVTPISYELNNQIVDAINNLLNPPKAAPIKDKEYEILSFICFGNIYTMDKNNWWVNEKDGCKFKEMTGAEIHSVKRLSDGEVFTIGDKVNVTSEIIHKGWDRNPIHKIYSFGINDDKTLWVGLNADIPVVGDIEVGKKTNSYMSGIFSLTEFEKAKPQKEPLFTTEDGQPKYKGDNCFFVRVNNDWSIHEWIDIDMAAYTESFKYFSTQDAANKYITLNKPCLSLNDVRLEIMGICDGTYGDSPIDRWNFSELVGEPKKLFEALKEIAEGCIHK